MGTSMSSNPWQTWLQERRAGAIKAEGGGKKAFALAGLGLVSLIILCGREMR